MLSLSMIVLMLALPWTAVADSSGRGNGDESEKVKITTQREEDQNRVKFEVEFENLMDYITYDYEITITRVDPDFVHQQFTGNFTTGSEVHEFTIIEYWEPDQEGPYTVHSSLIQYESAIANGTDAFDWGDIDSNSEPASLVATAEPLLTHYDIFGNASLEGNVTFHIYTVGTETGAAYKSMWELYEGDDEEFGGLWDADYIVGEGPSNWQTRYVDMVNLADWENNTNYTIATWLYRVDTTDEGGNRNVEVNFQTWKFAIGEEPELTIQPVITGCTDSNATNYDPDATEEDDSCEFLDSDGDGVYDYLEIEGCTDEDALNTDEEATDDDGSCIYPRPMQVELTANQTSGEAPLSVAFFAEISEGRAPYQISWEFGDGTIAENLVNITHTFSTPGMFTVVLRVTDSDGDEIQRTIPIIATEPPGIDELTGYISHSGQLDPINKDMVATVEFYATVSGGEGPYTYTWKFGDDTGGTGSTILHEYANGGEFLVELIVEDSVGRTLQLGEIITITKEGGEGGGVTPPLEEVDEGESNFDIYATSTGAIGLLLVFGLFGRKRRDSFLESERRVSQGEGSMWDKY